MLYAKRWASKAPQPPGPVSPVTNGYVGKYPAFAASRELPATKK